MSKKPTRLEWTGGILDTAPENSAKVSLKGDKPALQKASAGNLVLTGNLKIRRESKGRGGHPVSILCEFSDPNSHTDAVLQKLCSDLKSKLGCGGTAERHQVVLQTENRERLKEVLAKMGLEAKIV